MPSQLPNYLRAHRKRLALSQEDVAFLLGVGSGAKVCRHERFLRVPELESLLAYEAIFQKPLRELFAGSHQKALRQVAARARKLVAQLKKNPSTSQNKRKLETLEKLARLITKKP